MQPNMDLRRYTRDEQQRISNGVAAEYPEQGLIWFSNSEDIGGIS